MAELIPPPDPQALIPPLLACLPTSFASSRPPPSLLTLLSPILRQRLHIFTSTSTSGHDDWLRLLCWDPSKAETLKETVENANFEPHPVSGEVEIGDIEAIKYRRFDKETLKAQIPLSDWSLTATYLWCASSEEGNAWKLAELLPFDSDLIQDSSWLTSLSEANAITPVQTTDTAPRQTSAHSRNLSVPGNDEDDYWAQYDSSPNRTPARKDSTNPAGPDASEADYYSRYGEVQPAMDNHDPDEQHEGLGESSLDGNAIQDMISNRLGSDSQARNKGLSSHRDGREQQDDEDVVHVDHPMPSSPSSRADSDTIPRLEKAAEKYSASEVAIKQHISTTMKSMYRLAKGAGIPRKDFEDMVSRELETLSIFDRDD